MVHKIRPLAAVNEHYNADGWNSWYDIDYQCPVCGRNLMGYGKEIACDQCGTFFDWGTKRPKIKVTRTVEWYD